MIKIGSDFSGVGALNQALNRLKIDYDEIFACDMDKYARDTFVCNYGEPKYFPLDVYEREIPAEPLDLYVSSPPCQAFSLAGMRLGKEDKRGILFFNSLEFIKINKPRYFIFENVRGLLSENNGNTFSEWINLLGGKSVNGIPILFPYDDSVPYHLYWRIINAKDHGIPQNRERIFLVGIRDDRDNFFRFPKEEHLIKRLKDVLEDDVDDKYYLSEKMFNGFIKHNENHNEKGTGFIFQPKNENDVANCLRANGYKLCPTDNTIRIKSATLRGYENATNGDSIYLARPGSGTRRGRVGKQVAQTLETGCQQGVIYNYKLRRLTPRECFRLMDFPDTFIWNVSDTQAYKQAGNSICVNVLFKIIKNLNL